MIPGKREENKLDVQMNKLDEYFQNCNKNTNWMNDRVGTLYSESGGCI